VVTQARSSGAILLAITTWAARLSVSRWLGWLLLKPRLRIA